MFRTALTALAISTATIAIAPAPATAQMMELPEGEIDRLSAMQMLQLLQSDPQTISQLGLIPPVEMANSPYAMLTPQGMAKAASDRAMLESFVTQLDAIDRDGLPADQQLSYDIWHAYLSNDLAALEAGVASGTSPYVVDQFWVQGLPSLLGRIHQLSSPFLAEAYVQRLEQVAAVIAQREERFEAEADSGVLPPQIIIDNVIADIDSLLSGEPEDHFLYTKLVDDMPEGVEDPEALKARALAAMRDGFYPAYRSIQDALKARRDSARTTRIGILGLPGGDAKYAALAKRWTTTDIDPGTVHDRGLAEVARIKAEIDRRLTALGYTEGTLLERFNAARVDGLYGYPDNEEGAQALLQRTDRMVAAAKEKTAPFFNRFPKADVLTIPVPPSAQASAPNSYTPPAADGSRPGVFNINLQNPSTYGEISYPSLVFHETIPGHHYQIALQQETDLPLLRRFLPFSAYSEGWGLYVEVRAEEMGLYEDNPLGVLGALSSELFRAARLVVDTGIHAKGWSREEAQQYMRETIGSPATREIDRYIVWPGQALAYKTGQLKLEELRARAETRLGDDFDVAAFHDQILQDGSMPLSVLEAKIDRWIEAQADD